jgi:cytidyltransferase-like protein
MGDRFVVYVDMVGDLFHAGHVSFLRKARDLATTRAGGRPVHLVVGVMGDEDATRYKRRPLTTMAERVGVIEACRLVDDVVAPCPSPLDDALVDELGIDLVVHGDDYDAADVERWYRVAVLRGVFATVPYSTVAGAGEISTSGLIERIRRAQ